MINIIHNLTKLRALSNIALTKRRKISAFVTTVKYKDRKRFLCHGSRGSRKSLRLDCVRSFEHARLEIIKE